MMFPAPGGSYANSVIEATGIAAWRGLAHKSCPVQAMIIHTVSRPKTTGLSGPRPVWPSSFSRLGPSPRSWASQASFRGRVGPLAPCAETTALLPHRVDAIDSLDLRMVSIHRASARHNIRGLPLIANESLIEKVPVLVRKTVAAIGQTITASRRDPEHAIASLLKRAPTLDKAEALRTLNCPSICCDLTGPKTSRWRGCRRQSLGIAGHPFRHGPIK